MQIEVGEYKTRDGDEVKIIAVIDGFAIGYFTESGPETVSTWRSSDGGYYATGTDEFDLVRKKPKRIKKKVWVTVYKECCFVVGGGYDSLEGAKENTTENCIAITSVEIDCEEGENLD